METQEQTQVTEEEPQIETPEAIQTETQRGDLYELCGLWRASSEKQPLFFAGNLQLGRHRMRIFVFPNRHKQEGDNRPDARLCVGGFEQIPNGNGNGGQKATPNALAELIDEQADTPPDTD